MTSIQIDVKDGLSSSTAIKGPVKAATTANITLSGAQTIDGVSIVTDDRVLVMNQTTASENGIYIADTGPWRRSKDFNKTRDVKTGTMIFVTSGTANAGLWEVTTADPITVGTSSISFGRAVQPLDADLTAIAALTTTVFGRNLLTLANASAGRTSFGLDKIFVLSDYANLAAAITAIGSTPATLLVDRNETVSSNTTLVATTQLEFNPNCILSVATATTLTINGSIEVPAGQQIFAVSGTGKVALVGSLSGLADVTWFGAKADQTGTDDAPAVNAAIASQASRVVASGRFNLQTSIDFTPWADATDPAQRRKVFDASAATFTQTANLATAVNLCPSDGSLLYKKTILIGSLYGAKGSYTNTRAVYLRHVANCIVRIDTIELWAGKGFEADQTGTPSWGGFGNDIRILRVASNNGDGFYAAAATTGVLGFEGNTVCVTHSITNGGRAVVLGSAANQRVEGNTVIIGSMDGNTGTGLYWGGKANDIIVGAVYSNGSPDIDCATGITERTQLRTWKNSASTVISTTVYNEHGVNRASPTYLSTGSSGTPATLVETTLKSYSIPASTLKPGMRVRLIAWGTVAANANTKTVKLKFGALGGWLAALSGPYNATPWKLSAEVEITGASTQAFVSDSLVNASVGGVSQGTGTETDTSAIVCAVTGQNGTATLNDIVCNGFRVEIVGA